MADVFTIDPMSPVGAPAPVLTGGYYPSIDQQMINGMGIIIPWGGGSLQRAMLSSGEAVGAPVTPENKFLSMMATFMPAGDIYNYNFEGLMGPPGPPGQPGPQGLPALPTLGPSGIGVPVRALTDGATPATVTGLNATAGIQYVVLEWTANSETDMDHYEIWRYTSDVSGSASKIAEAYQTMMVDGGLTADQIYYYWVKAVDHLGNTSGFSSSVNATSRDVGDSDVAGNITAAKILIDGEVYLSNWRKGDDLTMINGGMISTSTITATQIAASTITAAEIAAATITAAEIVAGTITYDNLRSTSGSEAVDTGVMRDEAVTIGVSAYTEGETGWGFEEKTIQSVEITTIGQAVLINASFVINSNADCVFVIRLYRGATEIYDSGDLSSPVDGARQESLTFVDSPSADTYTYYLKIESGTPNTNNVTCRQLRITEFKK